MDLLTGDRQRMVVTSVARLGAIAVCLALAAGCGGPRPAGQPDHRAVSTRQGAPAATLSPPATAVPAARPTILAIPRIGVRAPLGSVGLTAQGTLEVPAPGPHYDQPAWYRYSPTPGSVGPAVVLGHVDSAANGPSVFYRLHLLRPGDRVEVTRVDGRTAIFNVDSVRQFPKADFPTALVYANTAVPALRLITCGGRFDSSRRSYVDNVVVLATLVGWRRRTT